MANTWITDATHFLDSAGRIVQRPGSRGIVKHIGAIISSVTEPGRNPQTMPTVPCRRRPGRAPCPGVIVAGFDPDRSAVVWECPSCGDRGWISSWQRTPWDRGGRPVLPEIHRVTYRTGMLDETTDTSDLRTIVLEGATLSRDVLIAILDNGLLNAGGVYGDPQVGWPIQYDELVFKHVEGKTSIRVFNCAIGIVATNDEIYVRVHRVCATIEQLQRELRA